MPTAEKNKKDRIPIVQHSVLAAAAFMTALDRTKTLKGGFAGVGLAAGFIGLRHMLTPKSKDWRDIGRTAWGGVEFSAITSLLGSSMMKGGFLHKSVGVPVQRWFNTAAYQSSMKGISSAFGSQPMGQKAKTLLEKYPTLADLGDYAASEQQKIVNKIAMARAGEGKYKGFKGFRVGRVTGPLERDVTGAMMGEVAETLRGAATGPRGPFEVLQGMGDIATNFMGVTSGANKMVSDRIVQSMKTMGGRLGPVGSAVAGVVGKPIGWAGGKILGPSMKKEFAALSDWKFSILPKKFDKFKFARPLTKERSTLKVAERLLPFRPYIEGVFGSPVIGRSVKKFGSLKNIPIPEYISGNVQDIFYGAAPGIALMSPFIAWQAGKVGLNKAYNKITGHRSGWANKNTELSIDSDFTAGESWTGIKNSIQMFAKYRKKSVVSGALAASMFLSPTAALAKDVGVKFASKSQIHTMASVAKRASNWRDIVDTVTKMTDPTNSVVRSRAANLIYRTGIHEGSGKAGFLKYVKQVGGGPARGLTQVEKSTAYDIVQNWARYRERPMEVLSSISGKSKKEIISMSGADLGGIIEKNQAFAAAMTRFKYRRAIGAIPEKMEDQAAYWAKNYWAGNESLRSKKAKQFVKNNIEFDKNVVRDLKIPAAVRNASNGNTMGLTNEVLYDRRINHTIINQAEKNKHLYKI